MRIFLCNVGYLLGDREFAGGYLPSPREACMGAPETERAAFDQLVDVIDSQQPDVVCLVEVDRGSFRTASDCQVTRLRERLASIGLQFQAHSFIKYDPDGIIGRLPFFRHLSNAILLDREVEGIPRYLEHGMKRLVIDIDLQEDLRLLLVHLALRQSTRARQLRELADIVSESTDERVILAGDLNVFQGVDELDEFRQLTGLEPHIAGPTIPERPFDDVFVASRTLDFFLASPNLGVDAATLVGKPITDHRPAMLTVQV